MREINRRRLIFLCLFFMLIVIEVLFAVGFSSASDEYLKGDFVVGEPILLYQGCGTCTALNFSVYSPSGELLVSNQPATGVASVWNYTLNASYVLESGDYTILGSGNPDGEIKTFKYFVNVQPSGIFALDFSSRIGLIVLVLCGLAFFVFLFFRQFLFAGAVLFILGFVFLFNGFPYYVSVLFIVAGALLMGVNGK